MHLHRLLVEIVVHPDSKDVGSHTNENLGNDGSESSGEGAKYERKSTESAMDATYRSPINGAVDGLRHERRQTETADAEHERMGYELIPELGRREGGERGGHD